MNIELIDGEFNPNEALDIISQMIQVKIKFHENKIHSSQNEEDTKARENKIKQLQYQLHTVRGNVQLNPSNVRLSAHIQISVP